MNKIYVKIINGRNYRDSLVNIFSVERSSQESRGFSHERFNKAIIQIQWNYVLYPASQKQWEQISNSESIKFIHIKNFYIVFSKNASWFRKIFFLRRKSNTFTDINDTKNDINNKKIKRSDYNA